VYPCILAASSSRSGRKFPGHLLIDYQCTRTPSCDTLIPSSQGPVLTLTDGEFDEFDNDDWRHDYNDGYADFNVTKRLEEIFPLMDVDHDGRERGTRF